MLIIFTVHNNKSQFDVIAYMKNKTCAIKQDHLFYAVTSEWATPMVFGIVLLTNSACASGAIYWICIGPPIIIWRAVCTEWFCDFVTFHSELLMNLWTFQAYSQIIFDNLYIFDKMWNIEN